MASGSQLYHACTSTLLLHPESTMSLDQRTSIWLVNLFASRFHSDRATWQRKDLLILLQKKL